MLYNINPPPFTVGAVIYENIYGGVRIYQPITRIRSERRYLMLI